MKNRTWLQPFALTLFLFPHILQAQPTCQPPTPVLRENIFTEEQEMFLGEAIAEHIQRSFSIVQNDELTSDLRQLGERLSKHLPPHKLRFQFFLIESSDANAFVLPGGRIYVTRKLIAFVQSEDELAGVLAHEMGHMIARQGASDMTRLWREVLKISQVTDRQDIFTKYNQLVDNAARNPKAFAKLDSHEDKDQVVADQIGLYAMAGAGFEPQAFSRFFDRLAETKGKTGGFFSDLFGVTNPNAKRLREMIRAQGALPESCIEARSKTSNEDFKKWQQAVIAYNGGGKKEALRGVLSKTVLEPALRGDVTHLRFSPDGKYVIAQDDSGINVLTREPFKTLFRIAAPEATNAQFTPDSQQIVFYNSDLRIETWNLAEQKMKEVHELFIRNQCVQSQLSPDGKTLACLDGEMTLNLYEVATGTAFFQKKNFYRPDSLDIFVRVLNGILNSDDSGDFELDWINMNFSPDSRYFAAGKRSLNFSMIGVVTDESALAFDLQSKAPVQLKGLIKKLIAGNFAFLAPDKVIGSNPGEPKKSGIVSFPSGEVIEQFEVFPGKIAAPAKGNYLLVRPFAKHAVGVMDLQKKMAIKGNKTAAFDMYDQVFVAERLNGEIGLYGSEKNDLLAVVQLPRNELGRLRATAISPDFKWLAVSERTRGAVWDMSKGERTVYIRGFRGAHLDNSVVFADFPKFEQEKRMIGVIDAATRNGRSGGEITEDRARQYGPYLLMTKPAKKDGGYAENVIIEAQNISDLKTLWSKEFSKEAPRIWLDPNADSFITSWAVSTKAAQAELKNDPALKQKLGNKKEQEGDYFLQVFDARTGTMRGKLLIETGKGSFRVSNVFAAQDYVIVSDTENRVQVYSLSSGERKGQVFGGRAAASAKTNLLCVENERGQLTLYDLATLQQRDQFNFANPVMMTKFSADGQKLFVLTANQTAYVLEMTTAR